MGLGGDDGSVATGNAGYLQTSSFDHHPDDDDDDADDDDYYYCGHHHHDDQIMMISICISEDSASGNTGRPLEVYFPFLGHLTVLMMQPY